VEGMEGNKVGGDEREGGGNIILQIDVSILKLASICLSVARLNEQCCCHVSKTLTHVSSQDKARVSNADG
jgi:hypothetical protein